MKLTTSASAPTAGRRLARAAAIVRTEMAHRRPSHGQSPAVSAARRAADRFEINRRIAGSGEGH
jgi:hypothetical protein